MEFYFVNNLDLPHNDRKRKGELYDRYIDEYFLPADVVCIAGGISEFLDIEITFLIKLAQKYPKVYYVYGGCDLKSDIPLDLKFETIKNNFRRLQKNKCTPERLDGNIFNVDELVLGGFMGFDMREDISQWNWWTESKKDYMDFEKERYEKIINKSPVVDVMVSYYEPKAMKIKNESKAWHYGYGNKKEIKESDGKLLITNSCHVENSKFTKHDFLINL
jgi:hypothetical protein